VVKINIAECRKKGLDANSLLIMSIIESRNLEDWKWLNILIPYERMQKYLTYLYKKGFITTGSPYLHDLALVRTKPKKVKDSSDFGSFVEEWYSLWEKGIETMGHPIRSGQAGCATKLKAFFKTHGTKYSPELVMKVTKDYINYFKNKGYQGIQTAQYFISKNGNSNLESWCERETVGKGVMNKQVFNNDL
jgi:hypothetical protein